MAARELLLLPQEEAEAEAEAGRHVITLVVAAVSLVPRMRGAGSVTPTTKLEPFPRSWRQILFVEKCIPPPPQLLPFILQ